MSRLRRTRSVSTLLPLAAEVLEARSLLSGAAAAVHAALHHSQATAHASPGVVTPASKLLSEYQVTAQATTDKDTSDTPAQLFISTVPLKAGAHVTANVGFAAGPPGEQVEVVVKLTGTVKSFTPLGNTTVVTLKGGGSIVQSLVGLPRSITFKAVPNGSPLTITLDNSGNFLSLEMNFKVVKALGLNPPKTIDLLCFTA